MRSLRSATWTSGEPVSLSWVLYVLMISVLRSFVNATCDPPRTAQNFAPWSRAFRPAGSAPDRRICLNRLVLKTYYLILPLPAAATVAPPGARVRPAELRPLKRLRRSCGSRHCDVGIGGDRPSGHHEFGLGRPPGDG